MSSDHVLSIKSTSRQPVEIKGNVISLIVGNSPNKLVGLNVENCEAKMDQSIHTFYLFKKMIF